MTTRQRLCFIILIMLLRDRAGEDVWFHHGDCIGADAEAHSTVAELTDWYIGLHPGLNKQGLSPTRAWSRGADRVYRPKQYLVRDELIARKARTLMIATPNSQAEQVRSGTWTTVRMARRLGRGVILLLPDGSVA